ncbi:HEXXH motif domain-containing protein [Amycolatopsis sp. BJA-103]|uniref:HEXXH motif domain-containing protein n=1 Tax=Amycolatopsis sp. BJA-103 TaxID=1911175 RepID=UPI000C78A8FF|nr:HEXXH motif domain-containing protein [Amycolatopsis sp. BJA-103]AUI63950.1 HEXXH motif domain-containing protein [Amycolatopsis sp. BJA-103]PNE15981.1 HEXXH motif domain-containing protein [Amycolatopsis sp. BJA-103]
MSPPAEARPAFHRLSWRDFDALARLDGDEDMARRLRRAERSRRKLLIHALLTEATKTSDHSGPLPSLDSAWELLARAEARAPRAVNRMLTNPYTGSWAGYTTRLLRNGIDGVGPLWMHLGHAHAIAAAAAIRAELDFETAIPVWHGNAILPSLGMARFPGTEPFSSAIVRGANGRYSVSGAGTTVRLPSAHDSDAPGWWGIRRVRSQVGAHRFSLWLDDLDPYRGLYEPVPPERLPGKDLADWQGLIDEACRLIAAHLPGLARIMPVGLASLVPKPQVLFRNPSASTGEAFGSAVVGLPSDGASLADTLIHEFQHIVLGGLLHLVELYEPDPRERIYVAWRDDPRPLSGALQGVYAFFGVTAFWRALHQSGESPRRSGFEFAFWRRQTWRTLQVLRVDSTLTAAGRRFLDDIAERLGPWQDEPVPTEASTLATAACRDHLAGWRARHLRPDPSMVSGLAAAWLSGRPRPPATFDATDLPPTPVPDGGWSHARTDLIRLTVGGTPLSPDGRPPAVPGATAADFAYAAGDFLEAINGYREELARDPDRPASLVGLGLALSARGPHPAARALLHCPEIVRAVHRPLRAVPRPPTVEQLASWIGQLVPD